MQTKSKAIVYSQENCTWCNSAKSLLHSYGYEVEVRMVGDGEQYTKQDLLAHVPNARSVPQIFIGDQYIGGYQQLRSTLTTRE